MNNFRVALCLIFSSAAMVRGQSPVAVLTTPGDARLLRAGHELSIAAAAGDLLFPGDRVTAGRQSAQLLFCPSKESINVPPAAGVRLEESRLVVSSGSVDRRPAPVCALPAAPREKLNVPRLYGLRFLRASGGALPDETVSEAALPPELRTEYQLISESLARSPESAELLLARAALFERAQLHAAAASAYQAVAARWTTVDWPRRLVHDNVEQARRRVTTEPKAAPQELNGTTYALAIGVSRYLRLEPDEQLRFANRDAATVAEFLKSPRGGSIPDTNLRLLTDAEATTAAIRSAMGSFLKNRAGPKDTVVFFIAAHGVVDDTGSYIVTHDSDPQDLRTTAISMDEIRRLFETELNNVGRLLLYVDVCRAGALAMIDRRNSVNVAVEKLASVDPTKVFTLLGSGPGQSSFESERFGGGHGAFSYFLLQGLNGEANDGRDNAVDAGELFEFVLTKVRDATLKKQTPQKTGLLEESTRLVPDLAPAGIRLAGWQRLENLVASAQPRSTSSAPPDSAEIPRFLPTDPAEQSRLREALDRAGQAVLLRYLRGEEDPQTKSEFARGAELYETAQRLEPEADIFLSRALFCRGRARLFDRDYPGAIADLERSSRLEPESAFHYNALGIAYLELARFREAVAAFRDAIQRAPQWIYPHHNLALAYTELGEYDQARRAYDRAVQLGPAYGYLQYNLGLLEFQLNRRRQAEAAYRRAAALRPQWAEPWTALGVLFAAQGRRAPAEQAYREALRRKPDDAAALHNLGLLLARDPRRAPEAVNLWRELVAKQDYLPSRIALAGHLEAMGEFAEARRAYQEILDRNPESVDALRALVRCDIVLGGSADAVELVRRRLAERPGDPLLLELQGDLAARRGDPSTARAGWTEALARTRDPEFTARVKRKMKDLPR